MVLIRKTWGFGPFKVTVSPKGVGMSAGNKVGRIQEGRTGMARWTVRAPGTGASIRRSFKKSR